MDIIIQAIGGLGVLASIISFQCKKHNSILTFRTLNEFMFAIQYFLLGAYTGMAMNLVGCVRNIVFTKQVAQNKKTTVTTIIFAIVRKLDQTTNIHIFTIMVMTHFPSSFKKEFCQFWCSAFNQLHPFHFCQLILFFQL